MHDEQLQKYFEFDEADLYANRNGSLSQKQRERLLKDEKAAKSGTMRVVILGVILLGVASLPILLPSWFGPVVARIIWLIIWGLLGLGAIWLAYSVASSQHDYTLQKVEGPINIVKEEFTGSKGRTYRSYELHVGGVEFDVESELGDYMMQRDGYAIYYLKDGESILSLERLAKAT